jgi:GNAT superfamily N-acetyltransferase
MPSIRPAVTDDDYVEVGRLVRAYLDSLPFDVSFQDTARELVELRQRYGPPRGAAFLADVKAEPAGVVALKDLGGEVCEMKRLFVTPAARGSGAGRALAAAVVAEARRLGYRSMRLDTNPAVMTAAGALYESMGFVDIPAYNDNPIPGIRFMELTLWPR